MNGCGASEIARRRAGGDFGSWAVCTILRSRPPLTPDPKCCGYRILESQLRDLLLATANSLECGLCPGLLIQRCHMSCYNPLCK